MSRHSEEIAYLKRLIEDFPADIPPEDAPHAFQTIAIRYQGLEQSHHVATDFILKNIQKDQTLAAALKRGAFLLHTYLFDGILSNAGEARKASDPNNGRIGFGGLRHQQQRSKFYGTAPSLINAELDKAFSHLVYEPDEPVESALRFYQHFVYIHPFYDANGRIGRVLVSTYLNLFGCYVRWGEFDGANNSKFISKLNACHKRMESGHTFENYFGYLLEFFKEYVISVDELSDFK
ncbi:MAG TPA: Fic family protein [Balneolaceae bacterium]